MHKLVLATVSLSAAVAAQAPVGVVSPWSSATPGNNPIVNTTVVNLDEVGNVIVGIDQFEARHIGGGIYRCAATIEITGATDTKLIIGSLNLSGAAPVWTPSADAAALNQAGTGADEFQLSLSADGLTAVWDRYTASTVYACSATHPAVVGQTWMCTRASTAVPFACADIKPIGGVGTGGVDPHIAEESGNLITLYHIDFAGATPDIIKGTFDKTAASPTVAGTISVVATHAATPTTFSHSPTAMRDSTGKARSLVFSEYKSSGGTFSDGFFQEGVVASAERQEILDGQGPPLVWHNNPATIGGTFHYCTSGQTEPNRLEVCALANATLTGGGRIVAFAPARPNGGGTFISAVGIGTPAGFGYPVPPVVGDIWIFPSLGILDIRFHNAQTGLAEWVFGPVPPLGTLAMQLVTLDTAANVIRAGNDAVLVL